MAKTRRAPEDEVRKRRPDDDEDDAPRQARRRDDDDEEDDQPFAPRKKRRIGLGPDQAGHAHLPWRRPRRCIIILLIWVYSPVGTDHSLLCYFPPETTRIQGYDVEEGVKNHKLKEVHDMLLGNYRQANSRRFVRLGRK